MANEHTLYRETHKAVGKTVADGTGLEKGTLCKATDPNTAAATDGVNQPVAGVLKVEKIASNGQTQMPFYRGGEFKATASGSITVGDPLVTGGANVLQTASTNEENVVGISLETATNGQTFLYELRPTTMQLA